MVTQGRQKCPQCGAMNLSTQTQCMLCRAPLPEGDAMAPSPVRSSASPRACTSCGAVLGGDGKFCGSCGTPVTILQQPFPRSQLSPQETAEAIALIRHLQEMVAYQQLSMEIYSDSVARAAGVGTPTNEGLIRSQAPLSNPAAVKQHVIPALSRKIEILQSMRSAHSRKGEPASKALSRPYSDFTAALLLMQQRAQLQLEGYTAWVQNPTLAVDISRLDRAEWNAITKSAKSLNELIVKAGLDTEAWLEINREAFDAVRTSVGLPPMSADSFRSTYFGGLAGRPARFFDQ